eukprot:433873-Amphidinium_carterae.1
MMRHEQWHQRPLHLMVTKHLTKVFLGPCEYSLEELCTLYAHATPEERQLRQVLRNLVQAARTMQVRQEHRDATKEWRRWLAEEANKGSKRAHAWMKNEPPEGTLGEL